MKKCPKIAEFEKNINTFIKQSEDVLKDDTLSEIDSADTETTLRNLYAYREALLNNDLEFINSLGSNTVKNKNIAEETFKDTFGESFFFTYGNSKTPKQGKIKSVNETENGIEITFVSESKGRRYSFPLSSNKRSHTTKNKSFINIEGFRDFLDNYYLNKEKIKEQEIVLGSREQKSKLGERYKEDGYVHSDINHIKSILTRLNELGGSKSDKEELDYLNSLIDRMDKSFFNDLALYIKTEADKTDGVYRSKSIDMFVNALPIEAGNQQTEASVYMEEVIHSMTASALYSENEKSNKLKRRLEKLVELSRKQLTWKDFLPENSINEEKEEAEAKFIYNYIFKDKNRDYEFVAKGLTVPVVIKAFKKVQITESKEKKTILEKINDFFAEIIDVLRGNITLKDRSKNVHESLANLAFSLGEINLKRNRELNDNEGYLSKVIDIINSADDKTANILNNIKDTVVDKLNSSETEEIPNSFYGKTTYLAKAIAKSFVNPTYTKVAGSIAGGHGLKPEGTVREIVGGLFESDTVQRVAEKLVMQSGYIDKLRNNQIDLVKSNTIRVFKQETNLSKQDQEALTEILAETDLSGIIGKKSITNEMGDSETTYNNKAVRKLLTNKVYLDNLITKVKKSLKDLDYKNYNWHRDQAVGLGIYMATHTGNSTQNLNAYNIAAGYQSNRIKKVDKNVEKAIDELSTLVAIKQSNQEQKNQLESLMKRDFEGVQAVADTLEGFKINSSKKIFNNNKVHQIKGYVKEIFDDSIIIEIDLASKKEEMESRGFQFKSTLQSKTEGTVGSPLALYVTSTASRPDRVRGATRLNQITSKGTTMMDVSYKDRGSFENSLLTKRALANIKATKRKSRELIKKMEQGNFQFKDAISGLVPILDNDGEVVDYRYMMSKEDKKLLLKQNKKISDVLGRSFGSILDKEKSKEQNKNVLNSLVEDMNENWTSGTKGNDGLTDYALIGPESSNPEHRKLYYMLPYEFREYIKNRADKTLAVRRDLMFIYFGYSNLSIVDFPMLKKVTPKVLIRVLQFAEMMWIDVVKIVKGNILIKTPAVLIGNILSNFIVAVLKGHNPIKVLRMYVESYRDIKNYNNKVKNIQRLENTILETKIALNKDVISKSRKEELVNLIRISTDELSAENERLQKSPIDELVKLGLDQNVEDSANEMGGDSNRITNFVEDKLEYLPELVRDGLDILFITRRTAFYKVSNEFLETSDLVARDIDNRLEKENIQKQANGQKILPDWWLKDKPNNYRTTKKLYGEERKDFLEKAKNQLQYDLVEDYVNYSKPSSRFEEYLNRVGILMFTKFVKRIQRIILKIGSKAPLKSAVLALAMAMLGGFPSIHEQSFFYKDWYGDSLGPGNVFPIYGPIDILMNFITPSAVRVIDDGI